MPLLSPEFDAKLEAIARPAAKASAIEHALRREIHVRYDEDPGFYTSLRERLEQIIADHRARRLDDAEQLSLLTELRAEAGSGRHESAESLGVSPRGYAILGLLRELEAQGKLGAIARDGVGVTPRDLAATLDGELAPYTAMVAWETREDLHKAIRRGIKDRLSGLIEDHAAVDRLAHRIVAVAQKQGRGGSSSG